MSLDCSKSVSQLNSIKELQKQLDREIAVFDISDAVIKKNEKLNKVYKTRKELYSSLNEIAIAE